MPCRGRHTIPLNSGRRVENQMHGWKSDVQYDNYMVLVSRRVKRFHFGKNETYRGCMVVKDKYVPGGESVLSPGLLILPKIWTRTRCDRQ